MAHLVEQLKSRARILHRQAQRGAPDVLEQLRRLSDFRTSEDSEIAETVRRRHCLALVATRLGFSGWPHLTAVLDGQMVEDLGTLLYPPGADAHSNIWSASYAEARQIREEKGGYLLGYKRHFFIADRYFIDTLGLDPEDSDWAAMGWNWARPQDPEARTRLYGKLIRRKLPAAPVG